MNEIPEEDLRVIEEFEKKNRYFISYAWYLPEVEVTEEEWIMVERASGFIPSGNWKRSTDGFSALGIKGRIER